MLNNVDAFLTKTPFMATTNMGATDPALSGLCGAVPIKYHPGSIAAYEEAGITIPDCAKP